MRVSLVHAKTALIVKLRCVYVIMPFPILPHCHVSAALIYRAIYRHGPHIPLKCIVSTSHNTIARGW